MPKVLTSEQIDQFWNDGYVFPFDCLTTEEAAECRRKLEEYEASIDGSISKYVRIKCHLAFKWLEEIAHHPKILDVVEDLIGPDILLYLSTFWFKDAGDGKFVSWHQDSALLRPRSARRDYTVACLYRRDAGKRLYAGPAGQPQMAGSGTRRNL